ncbi:uncharacterized protein ARMOST_18145 [Armillaria ostoyae]|uniref:Uncharacterized protein n=1 Tax=Armillaria ostoyae TaxID=47428 RepID=A0A284S0Y7_ARMOS|nr:uncharacterized protein ARMOST_18145 [Armillaria ostoyae]
MAEPTDPAALAALKAYDDASRELSALQDNLPDADEEGAVDAWVTKAQIQWKIAAKNWEAAEVTDRAWRQVERTFMKILPEVREKSLRTAFVEYNELAERAMQFDFDVVPLPIPKAHKLRGTSSSQRVGSHLAASPVLSRQKSLVPPATLSCQSTPASRAPKQPIPPATPPRQVSPAPVTLEKTPVPPPREPIPSQTKRPSSSTTKTTTGASSSFPPKPSTGPSFSGLRETDGGFGGAASLHYDSTAFQQPGWGSPAWSPAPTSDDEAPSPSRSSFGLSFGPAALLPSPSQFKKTSSTTAIQPSTSSLLTVDAATRPTVLLGPDPAHDEEEQGRGVMVDEERIEGSDDEDGTFQGQEDDAPTPPMDVPMDVVKEPTQQSDDAPSPPPSKARHQKPKISFVFDDTTGDFEDPHPTIFLPRPQILTSQEQALRRSTRPPASSVGPDAAYLQAAQGSKAVLKKKKKDTKGKFKGTEGATPHKRRRDDEGGPSTDKPAAKKLKSTATTVDDTKVAGPTKAFRKRGPAPSKPPAVTMGVSGGGFGEKVPASAKEVKNGIKNIGVLTVDRDFGDFVEVDEGYWNKEVAPFVGERYTEGCDHCKRLGTQCRKFLTNTVICVRCHYSKLPCKVKGIPALNPLSHYCPKSYQNLNAFEGALDTLDQHADALEDQIISYMAGLNILTQLNGLRVQAGRLRECAVYNGGSDEEDGSDSDDDDEVVAEGVAGPSQKKSKSG